MYLSFFSFLLLHSYSSDFYHFKLQHCKSQNKTNLECYYLPLSNCTLQDALKSTSGEIIPFEKLPSFNNDNPATYEDLIIKGAAG